MRYKIDGYTIKSENAAKSCKQQSRIVKEWILNHKHVNRIMDYGCGKLRYGRLLSKKANKICFVDSTTQLGRKQIIHNKLTSVEDYVKKHITNGFILTSDNITGYSGKFNLITCINVLSAIPCPNTFKTLLKDINRLLYKTGYAFFVTQYRNSYFSKYSCDTNSKKHFLGHIYKSLNGYSYYGIIDKNNLIKILINNKYKIIKAWTYDGSAYVCAKKE